MIFFHDILAAIHGMNLECISTINCTQHPYGDIGLPEMEEIIQVKYGDFSEYDAFMDDNMGFWTNDLDTYILDFIVRFICFLHLLRVFI